MTPRPLGLLVVGFSFAAAVAGQAPPLGGEFQANTYTTGDERKPVVASGHHGSFVVVWESDGQDGDQTGIFAQRFSNLGTKLGSEIPVNTTVTGNQRDPAAAMAGDGSFVVVWDSKDQDGSDYGVFGQRFGFLPGPIPKFARLGTEFPVNTYTTGFQDGVAIAADAQGDFVVVWVGASHETINASEIFGQRFNSGGGKVGPEFQVNSYHRDHEFAPAVGMANDGSFVVVWQGDGPDLANNFQVFGQRFGADAAKLGPEFKVAPQFGNDTSDLEYPKIAMDPSGDFVVVWSRTGGYPQSPRVGVQKFNRDAEKIGYGFLFPTYTTSQHFVRPSVAIDAAGNFVVCWDDFLHDGSGYGVFGQRFGRTADIVGEEFQVNVHTTGWQSRPAIADTGGGFAVAWNGQDQDGSGIGILGRRQDFRALSIAVDTASTADTSSNTNGVLEPGETVLVAPIWANATTLFADLTGSLSDFSGPMGGIYLRNDSAANYGTMPGNTIASCDDGSPDACYLLTVGATTRPAVHWDTTIQEDLNYGGSQFWRLHVGDSFTDVPRSEPFYKPVETLLHHGITSGCTATTYCPGNPVARDQMAIFIAKAMAGGGEFVPKTGVLLGAPYNCTIGGVSLFVDVSPTDPLCKHLHFIATQNVTLGCAPTRYCPTVNVTRDVMASLVAKAIVAPLGGAGVPLTYTDPGTARSYSCDAASPNLHFTDVTTSNAFCKHIHYLWSKGVVGGCSATQYCPSLVVNRDAMAKFLVNAFQLALYAP